ncbi:MAG: flippase-like domain-containing protein, partial [Methanocellales archaeon]|nr:flippase-like domain-containing protein [Methanocellales archaeon]
SAIGLRIALPIIVFVALAAALLTALPITPAGLGAVELAIVGVLMIVGIDKNLAVSVAILDRLISYWSLLIVGGLAYFITDKRR